MEFAQIEYDYYSYMLLVKCVGFIEANTKDGIDKENVWVIDRIVFEFSEFFKSRNLGIDQEITNDNFLEISYKIIEKYFNYFMDAMSSGLINPELSLTEEIYNYISAYKLHNKQMKRYKNQGTLYSDYENGAYYRLFERIELGFERRFGISATDICQGETIYHSFARFGALDNQKYFDYFKKMSDYNLINFENQEQERGMFDNKPCIYWFLYNFQGIEYYNYLIKNKNVKMNHISGNQTPNSSAFYKIAKMLIDGHIWDTNKGEYVSLDNKFRDLLFETLYNIVISNFSISLNIEILYKIIELYPENNWIKMIIEYLISEEGYNAEQRNNKYPVYFGGDIITTYNEQRLNENLDKIHITLCDKFNGKNYVKTPK